MSNAFGTTGLGFSEATSLMAQAVQSNDTRLREAIQKVGSKKDPSVTDMITLQMYIHTWSVVIEITSAIIKDVSDLFKSIVQRM